MPVERFTWQEPGAWRKPCIVHVTMVANNRQPLFGTLMHGAVSAYVEKTPLGQVNSQRYRFMALNEIGRLLCG